MLGLCIRRECSLPVKKINKCHVNKVAGMQCKDLGCLHNGKVSRDCMNTAGRSTLSQTAVHRRQSHRHLQLCVCVYACAYACVCVLFNVDFVFVWLVSLCVCVCAVSYTHLTLPTIVGV